MPPTFHGPYGPEAQRLRIVAACSWLLSMDTADRAMTLSALPDGQRRLLHQRLLDHEPADMIAARHSWTIQDFLDHEVDALLALADLHRRTSGS